jgi:hypothetical protein
MRYLAMVVTGLAVAAGALLLPSANVSYAAFHCMRIHAVKAGFGGNANIQYVELRMSVASQPLVAGHTIQFFDGSGTLKATFTFPANVTNAATGESILIATSEFNAVAFGGGADFTFSNGNTVGANGGDPLHPIQSPNGKIVWAAGSLSCSSTMAPVDSVATGTAAADYGTAAVPLAGAADVHALRLGDLNPSPTNNSAEYSLQPVATSSFAVPVANLPTDFSTPRNNARMVLQLNAATTPPSVGGIAHPPEVAAPAPLAHRHPAGGPPWMLITLVSGGAVAALGAGGLVFRARRARV